jgi:hypothetical protein
LGRQSRSGALVLCCSREGESLVEAVCGEHAVQAGHRDSPVAFGARPVEYRGDQCLCHAAVSGVRAHREHAELQFVRRGDLGERRARAADGDRAQCLVCFVCRDEEFGVPVSGCRVGQAGCVGVAG